MMSTKGIRVPKTHLNVRVYGQVSRLRSQAAAKGEEVGVETVHQFIAGLNGVQGSLDMIAVNDETLVRSKRAGSPLFTLIRALSLTNRKAANFRAVGIMHQQFEHAFSAVRPVEACDNMFYWYKGSKILERTTSLERANLDSTLRAKGLSIGDLPANATTRPTPAPSAPSGPLGAVTSCARLTMHVTTQDVRRLQSSDSAHGLIPLNSANERLDTPLLKVDAQLTRAELDEARHMCNEFHLMGHCRMGKSYRYSHEMVSSAMVLARRHQQRLYPCRKGNACRMSAYGHACYKTHCTRQDVKCSFPQDLPGKDLDVAALTSSPSITDANKVEASGPRTATDRNEHAGSLGRKDNHAITSSAMLSYRRTQEWAKTNTTKDANVEDERNRAADAQLEVNTASSDASNDTAHSDIASPFEPRMTKPVEVNSATFT